MGFIKNIRVTELGTEYYIKLEYMYIYQIPIHNLSIEQNNILNVTHTKDKR